MQQLHLVIPQFSFDMPFPSQIRMSRDSTALESIILDGFYAFYGPWFSGVTSDPLHVNKTG